MYPGSSRGGQAPHTPPPQPRSPDGAHPFVANARVDMLRPYEWDPAPGVTPRLHRFLPNLTLVPKRRLMNHSPPTKKRQRCDSKPQLQMGSPDLSGHGEVVAGAQTPTADSSPQPVQQLPLKPPFIQALEEYVKDKLSCQMMGMFVACHQQPPDFQRKEFMRSLLHRDISVCYPAYIEHVVLVRAKVPILKFRERGGGLEFDLNVNNTVGIRNTFLMWSYVKADPRIGPIILVVKKWARHHQINDASKGTLSSYSLVLMVLHFLQTRQSPVVPSLQRDHPQCFHPLMAIDCVPDGASKVPCYLSRNKSCLGELFLGFLKYYATEFRWDQQVISVREARILDKGDSSHWKNKYICVEEPFDRTNVARAVHEVDKFTAIKDRFLESWRILEREKDLNSVLPVQAVIDKDNRKR